MTLTRLVRIAAPLALLASAQLAAAATLAVSKSPTCGCCGEWVQRMRAAGFTVAVSEVADPAAVSRKLGVPEALRSCHTTRVAGYVIEGHVPAADIKRLLREKPKAIGLSVAGMPMGSPGMEHGGHVQKFNTVLIGRDGKQSVWARHGR